MKKMIRIQLTYGSARVEEDCSRETIEVLNKLSELAYKVSIPSARNGNPSGIEMIATEIKRNNE